MKEKDNNKNNDTNAITTVTFLNREQIDFLDKLGKDSLFKYGHKLSRSKILSDLVNLLISLKINIKDIDLDRESLSKGILRMINHEKNQQL